MPSRPSRRGAAALAAALLIVLACALPFQPATAAAPPGPAIDRILQDGGYQRDLPTAPAETAGRIDLCRYVPWLCNLFSGSSESTGKRVSIPPAAIAALLLIAVAFAAVYLSARGWPVNRGPLEADGEEAPADGRTDEALELLLADADRLAERGDFAEAIHLLLLRGIEDLRARLGEALAPSLTGREITRHAGLAAEARDALTRLALAAEICHFGGRSAGDRAYRACREDFLRFRAAMGGAAS